ncbi:MAG TPA: nitronate monooxygenase [Thermodesulfobacteriota bacterium]|nr:nitronate monooxygenase [Thermodesulfobacteriota bacterium]
MPKKNRICELLGIRYPILQAPMNWVSGAELAAAVSRAGGLGAIGPNAGADSITTDVELTGERLGDQIRRVRSLTENPFAVNIAIGAGESLRFSRKCVDVVIEEKIPAAIVSVGRPDVYTEELKRNGIKVLHAVSTARHARNAQAAGVDAVICEGYEAGGHKGFTELTTLALTPLVVDAVDIPVVSGGGVADERGVLAVLALGADAVYIGTRFMVTRESASHPNVKEAVVKGEDACTVSVPKEMMLARDLRNRFTEEYLRMKAAGASWKELMAYHGGHSQFHSQHLGDAEGSELCCGQGAGLIKDVESAEEVVRRIADTIKLRFESLKESVAVFSAARSGRKK